MHLEEELLAAAAPDDDVNARPVVRGRDRGSREGGAAADELEVRAVELWETILTYDYLTPCRPNHLAD